MIESRECLCATADRIADYRERVADSRVSPTATLDEIVAGFDVPLGEHGVAATQVLDDLARAAEPGLVASTGPRYFGFVTGGSLDAALCADLMVAGWDQLAFNAVSSPASVAAEVVAGRWLKELLALPKEASVGFVTGAQAANTVGLAAARHHVLTAAGWNDADGLFGAPRMRALAGDERHATIDRALHLLGIGQHTITSVGTTDQGAMDPAQLAVAFDRVADSDAPTIVCAQAGNVATGAFDDLTAICKLAHRHAQPGARAVRRQRSHRCGRPPCAGRRHVLGRRDDVARPAVHANLVVRMVDDGRGRRRIRACDARRAQLAHRPRRSGSSAVT
jgi:hypothetical protein